MNSLFDDDFVQIEWLMDFYCALIMLYIRFTACTMKCTVHTLNDNANTKKMFVLRLTCNVNQYQATDRNVFHGFPILNCNCNDFKNNFFFY